MPFEFTIGPLPLITKQVVSPPLSLPIPAMPAARPTRRAEDTSSPSPGQPAAAPELS